MSARQQDSPKSAGANSLFNTTPSAQSGQGRDSAREDLYPQLIFSVQIPLVEIVKEEKGDKEVAVYAIEVVTKYNKYRVGKRYNELRALWDKLRNIPEFTFKDFPPKTLFTHKDPTFLEHRRTLLEQFMQAVLAYTYTAHRTDLLSFLDYTKYNSIRKIVDSELADTVTPNLEKLETFLYKIALEPENRVQVLRALQKFMCEHSDELSLSSLKVFLLGETGVQGLLQTFAMSTERNVLLDLECNF